MSYRHNFLVMLQVPVSYAYASYSKQLLLSLGMLANSIRKKTSIHFGLYHSLFEWFNPLFIQDKANNWKTQNFVEVSLIA